MMIESALALQAAVIARLRGDAGLLALLGGAHVHDHVPRALTPPYVALARMETRPLGSSVVTGAEHRVVFHIWPAAQGRKDAHAIAAAIETALTAPLTLDGAHLVNLSAISWACARLDKDRHRGVLAIRAVTEDI